MKKFTDLKTIEDACRVLKLDLKKSIPDFSNYPERHRKSMMAHANIVLVVEAANQLDNENKPWEANFSNWDQPKFEIWFDYDKGSSGFRLHDYVYWDADSGSVVGSRLCFKSRECAEYIGKQFIDLYNEYLL